MEYLKAFTIGSSGLVIFPLLSGIANDNRFENKRLYSLIIPLYYALMSMLITYIGTISKLSLEIRFFIVFIISTAILFIINTYYNDKYYKTDTIINSLLLTRIDVWRQVITFAVLYVLVTNFSRSEALKIFVIGSSIFSYYINFYYTSQGDSKRLNYKYKYFAPGEAVDHGLLLLTSLFIGMKLFKLSLVKSLILRIIFPVINAFLVTILMGWTKSISGKKITGIFGNIRIYNYSFERYAAQLFLTGTIKVIIFYYLLTRLK